MNVNFSVGTDPEGFAVDKNGIYRSVIGLLGGTKSKPRPTKNGFVQEDNVAWEVNSIPATTEDMFVRNVLNVLGDVRDLLKPLDLSIDLTPVAIFPDEELKAPEAQLAGCDPDFNAWDVATNDPPDLSKTNMRSGAGHLHIAWPRLTSNVKRFQFTRIMDCTAGVPSIILDPDNRRRELYGKAGCFRPKDTFVGDAFDGIEYRTLSNFWLREERTIRWAYNTVVQAINRFDELEGVTRMHGDWIINIINTSNVEEARAFCETFNIATGE